MPVDFFRNEIQKIHDRFNDTFGKMVVCNVNTRQRVMLAIISLGILERKIMAKHDRQDIKRFVRTKNALNNFFDQIEEVKNVEQTNKRKTSTDTRALRNRAYTFAG